MPDYLIQFEAHIDETRRRPGFPSIVYIREHFVDIPDTETLKIAFNSHFDALVRNPGITVLLNPHVDSKIRFDQRVYIPWHMITDFKGSVKLLTVQKNQDLAELEPSDNEEPPKGTKQ